MKGLVFFALAVSLILMPFAAYAQPRGTTAQAPPLGQPLVREGDLAMKLVAALKMAPAQSEADAEGMLTAVGIAPSNGWIADYPVTPDIVAELRSDIDASVSSGQLALGREEAVEAFQEVTMGFGLPVVADTGTGYPENAPPLDYGEYYSPGVVNDYYYDQGPPVITYFPPPPDYDYLYSWVPYPFWWGGVGFGFSGFFILHDFHRVVHGNHHGRKVVSNHAFNPHTNRLGRIDPAGRATARGFRDGVRDSPSRGFASASARRSAESIVQRSLDRGPGGRTTNAFAARNVAPSGGSLSGGRVDRTVSGDSGGNAVFRGTERRSGSFNPQGGFQNRSAMNSGRSFGTPGRSSAMSTTGPGRAFGARPGTGAGAFVSGGSLGNRGGLGFSSSSGGVTRSFSAAGVGGGRGFAGGSGGMGRSGGTSRAGGSGRGGGSGGGGRR